MLNRNRLIFIILFFCFYLNVSYSNEDSSKVPLLREVNNEAERERIDFSRLREVGHEEGIREDCDLKEHIEKVLARREELHFANEEELVYAVILGYVGVVKEGNGDYRIVIKLKRRSCCGAM